MRIALLRRAPQASMSMDVYANGLVNGLRAIRPQWEIVELSPKSSSTDMRRPLWFRGISKYYARYWQFPKSLSRIDADIFHVVDQSDGFLCYWLKKHGKKSVVTCHDLINMSLPDSFEGRAYIPSLSMAFWKWGVKGICQADRAIAVSSHTKKDILQYLNVSEENISVIPNAVDPKFRPINGSQRRQFRKKQGIEEDTLCLLNVGSNNSRKNISTILAVVKELCRRRIPVRFWKVGADFTDSQLQLIQEYDICEHVNYLGRPIDETLPVVYSAADILIAPSLYEGFGLTVLEALACGTPVIASNVTSLPEVTGDAAILIPPQDVQAIANAVVQLRQDPESRQILIDRGLKRVKHFTWELTAECVASVYEDLLAHASISSINY